ncbi:MAG: hypothetical protein ACXW3K_02635 [Brevundimonas sp.]
MSVEAESIAGRLDGELPSERRSRSGERRGRDRRKPGSRINADAPRQSLLKAVGAFGVVFSTAAFVLTLLGGQMLDLPATVVVVGFEAAALITSVLLLALGSIELRLVEIRLELMMGNGGRRGEDRRGGDRRD